MPADNFSSQRFPFYRHTVSRSAHEARPTLRALTAGTSDDATAQDGNHFHRGYYWSSHISVRVYVLKVGCCLKTVLSFNLKVWGHPFIMYAPTQKCFAQLGQCHCDVKNFLDKIARPLFAKNATAHIKRGEAASSISYICTCIYAKDYSTYLIIAFNVIE